MSIPENLKYTKDHEWVRIDGDEAAFGVSDHAQEAIGDVVFVELPEVGRTVTAGEAFAVVESSKAVSDIYAPVSGEIIAVNSDLEDAPQQVNEDPYGKGWIARIKEVGDEHQELMDAKTYGLFLQE
ncbi:MAG: glycine cleavage system protein GcvH [Mariprofundaceae bacterium]|nr:glycine cleavage system protein GcvH [Mariprofundaceae bacterium]